MAYSSLNKKLLAIEDDLYMQKVFKEFLTFAFEAKVCPDKEKSFAFMQLSDTTDMNITDLNISQFQRS
jgi:hypothetical protein